MKPIVPFIIGLLLSTTTFAQQTADPAQDPSALGNAFFKGLLNEDSRTIKSLLATDFNLISFDGNAVDGDVLAQGIDGGYVVIETGVVSDAVTRQYNNDAAVMTGKWKSKGKVQDQGFENTVAFAVMCARQGGNWKIVNVQFTPAP